MSRIRSQTEQEAALVEKIQQSDKDAFKKLFDLYYAPLCFYANKIINSQDQSRDIVQDVYINIWNRREDLIIYRSLKAYMYQAVRNQALNHIDKAGRQIPFDELNHSQKEILNRVNIYHEPGYADFNSKKRLANKIWNVVEELPEKRKTVFILYRKHGLSYTEIAEVMGITRKTVENQMGRALKFLKEQLI